MHHNFLRIDFNTMKINFSFFTIFQCCSSWFVMLFDLFIEIKCIWKLNLESLYLENFFSSFGLIFASDKFFPVSFKTKYFRFYLLIKATFPKGCSVFYFVLNSWFFIFIYTFVNLGMNFTNVEITILWTFSEKIQVMFWRY